MMTLSGATDTAGVPNRITVKNRGMERRRRNPWDIVFLQTVLFVLQKNILRRLPKIIVLTKRRTHHVLKSFLISWLCISLHTYTKTGLLTARFARDAKDAEKGFFILPLRGRQNKNTQFHWNKEIFNFEVRWTLLRHLQSNAASNARRAGVL